MYSEWENNNLEYNVLVKIMMMRSQSALVIFMGPFGEISNYTLVSVSIFDFKSLLNNN